MPILFQSDLEIKQEKNSAERGAGMGKNWIFYSSKETLYNLNIL